MRFLAFAVFVHFSTSSVAQTLNEGAGIAELKLNGGCWPLGASARWPQDVTAEQMSDLARQGNANAQYLIALRMVRVQSVMVTSGEPVGIGINASPLLGRSPVMKWTFVDPVGAIQGLGLLRKSAEQNHVISCIELGNLYRNDDLLIQNINEAVKWWTKAAELGSEDAKRFLADAYRDAYAFVDAYMWYALASAQCLARGGDMAYYVSQRDYLMRSMSIEDVEVAKRQLEEWRRRHP